VSALSAALAYAAAGWPVFPCKPEGKAPLTLRGFYAATTDETRVRDWWARWPDANVAIPTGAATVDVLDVDVRPQGTGWEAFNRAKRAGLLVGAVRIVRTPSGGLHVWYPGTDQTCSTLRGRHLDLKATGGYVLVPPSCVVTPDYAGTYVQLDERAEGKPLDWPAIRRLLDPPAARPRRAAHRTGDIAALVRWVAHQVENNRNKALFWAACRAVEAGHLDLDELVSAAVTTGLPVQEAQRTVGSALRRAGIE